MPIIPRDRYVGEREETGSDHRAFRLTTACQGLSFPPAPHGIFLDLGVDIVESGSQRGARLCIARKPGQQIVYLSAEISDRVGSV